MDYKEFFKKLTGFDPYSYQIRLGIESWPDLLNIPTGLGKTAAVTVAWLYKILHCDPSTPRRLVYCLPMRVLAEQTRSNINNWLKEAEDCFKSFSLAMPGVNLLMGGEINLSWLDEPEYPSIIIGTQDMLLSRALMRGYSMSRYQWPIHFALLHNDAFWVFDEVQLMGPGLATSAQLEGLRRFMKTALQTRSLWLSATLNPEWLDTVDMRPYKNTLVKYFLSREEYQNPSIYERREAVKYLVPANTVLSAKRNKAGAKEYARDLSQEVLQKHRVGTTTLIVLNNVERAQALVMALKKNNTQMEIILIHARFRPAERRDIENRLRQDFLRRRMLFGKIFSHYKMLRG